jgi:hypothetical protein
MLTAVAMLLWYRRIRLAPVRPRFDFGHIFYPESKTDRPRGKRSRTATIVRDGP